MSGLSARCILTVPTQNVSNSGATLLCPGEAALRAAKPHPNEVLFFKRGRAGERPRLHPSCCRASFFFILILFGFLVPGLTLSVYLSAGGLSVSSAPVLTPPPPLLPPHKCTSCLSRGPRGISGAGVPLLNDSQLFLCPGRKRA